MKLSDLAHTAKFAHLLGIQPKRAQAEEDEETKAKRAQDDEEQKESLHAQSSEEEKDAEEDIEEESAEDESEEEKKSRKAKRAQSEDDEEESAQARGRRLERARAQAIFESPEAGMRPDIAAHLAFKTNLTSKEAITLLASVAMETPRRNDLFERMASVKNPNVGVEGGDPNDTRTRAAQILAAGKKARGEA